MLILLVAPTVTGNEKTDIQDATVGRSANGTVIEARLAGTPGAMTMNDLTDETEMVLMIVAGVAAAAAVVLGEGETDETMVALQDSKKVAEVQALRNHESPLPT